MNEQIKKAIEESTEAFNTLNFDQDAEKSVELKDRVETVVQRQTVKKLLNGEDSRINDSLKYLINGDTPQFGLGQNNDDFAIEESKIDSIKVFIPKKNELKYDISF